MRTLRVSLAGTVMVMCLALGGVPALAQEAVEEAPAGVTLLTGHETAWRAHAVLCGPTGLGRLLP